MGELRIVSGKHKGRKLKAPEGLSTRPLLSRLRKSLVDILRPYLPGAKIIDLFGGSGAIAFELLSGGAGKAVIIEMDIEAAELIRKNADLLKEDVRVIASDCLKVIPRLNKASERFDIVVAAPPYNLGLQEKVMEVMCESPVVKPGGMVIVQRDAKEPFWEENEIYSHLRTRKYGRTVFDFYELEN